MKRDHRWRETARRAILILILGGAFALRFTGLTTYKTLPGWDPSSHISKALTVISDGHLKTDLFWYPPGFHFLLATLFLLTGLTALDGTSLLIIKLLISTISALQIFVAYLVGRRGFGNDNAGVISALFITVSLRHMEMLGWGGYPNITGMLLMGLALYLLMRRQGQRYELDIALTTIIAGLVATHSISTFIFVAIILFHLISASIILRRPLKRESLTILFSLIIVFGFYSTFAKEHILFIWDLIRGWSPHISTTNPYVDIFGEIPSYLTPLGAASSLISLKSRRERWREILLLISWLIIPFAFFQTNFIARFANRFSYFLVFPFAYFPALGLTQITEEISKIVRERELILPFRSKQRIVPIAICLILSTWGTIHLVSDVPHRTLHYASYYLVCTPRDYDTSLFARTKTEATANILAAYPADPWISILTQRNTSSADVESVNFKIDNDLIEIQETDPYNVGRNPSLYLDIDGEPYEALRIKDSDLSLEFHTQDSKHQSTDISQAPYQRVEWWRRSGNSIGLRCTYRDEFYTLEKTVLLRTTSPLVELRYRLTPSSRLSNLNLTLTMVTNRELKYLSLFIPGYLEWLNPWDRPTERDSRGRFAYVSFPFTEIGDRFFALLDEDKAALLAFRIRLDPDHLTVGARSDRRIDTVKAAYRYSSAERGEPIELAFDILATHIPQEREMGRGEILSLIQQRSQLKLQSRDYLDVVRSTPATHIQGRRARLPTGYHSDPYFNRVFDNGLSHLYTFRGRQN